MLVGLLKNKPYETMFFRDSVMLVSLNQLRDHATLIVVLQKGLKYSPGNLDLLRLNDMQCTLDPPIMFPKLREN
jgi:hypothetical protein